MDPVKAQQLAAELEVEMMADMYNRYETSSVATISFTVFTSLVCICARVLYSFTQFKFALKNRNQKFQSLKKKKQNKKS